MPFSEKFVYMTYKKERILVMKKLLSLLLALAVSFSLAIPAFAANTTLGGIGCDRSTVLSDCPDDELLAFLHENDIVIPDGLADSQDHLLELVRYYIAEIELNPNIEFLYSLAQLQDFAYALKFAVNDFYGVDSSIQPFANYGLQDSTVYQMPSNMANYNCYAYALGRSSSCSPGEFSGHGNMTQTTLKNMSIYEVAQYVKDDLQSSTLNKKCVKITYTRPSYNSLVSGQSAICVRKGDNGNGAYDYHFMKLFSGDTWRHKPGRTAILTYDYLPSNSRVWLSEGYNGSNTIYGDIVYDSSIYYILFKSTHSYTHGYTGNNYHSGSKHYYEYADICTGCGDQKANTTTWSVINCSGPPCIDIMSVGVTK